MWTCSASMILLAGCSKATTISPKGGHYMRARLVTILTMVVCLLLMGGEALTQPRLPTFQPGDVLRARDLNLIVEQIRRNTPASGGSGGNTHMVDCSSGTITDALSGAQPGDTIMISGTCEETLVVDKDGITLDGRGSAIIDGKNEDAAVVKIRGQQNVTIKGLTVQNGFNGIKIVESAAAWLEDVTVQNSRYNAGHDSGIGIVVSGSASVVLTGSITASGNDVMGVGASNSSSVFVISNLVIDRELLPTASLEANRNGLFGIEIARGSSLHAFSGDSVPTTIQANNNGVNGINVAHAGSVQFGGGADVEAIGNEQVGLVVVNGSSTSFETYRGPSRGITARFNNNKGWTGIQIYDNSSLVFWQGSDISATIAAENNTGIGLSVGQNSSVRFETAFPQGASAIATFSNNGNHGVGAYQNSTVSIRMSAEIDDNTGHGFDLWGNCFVDLGQLTDGAVTVNDNGGHGIFAQLATVLALDGVNIENNQGNGILIWENGELTTLGGPTTISGNGQDGISASYGAGIYLVNTTVTGNTNADVISEQASRIGWRNSQVDTVNCDPTTMAFDDALCPEPQMTSQ